MKRFSRIEMMLIEDRIWDLLWTHELWEGDDDNFHGTIVLTKRHISQNTLM